MTFPLTTPTSASQEHEFTNRTDFALTLVVDVNNPVEGDLDIQDGQLYLATGLAAIAQRLKIKMRFFLGEWFLNALSGMPILQKILVKNPSRANILALYRNVILGDPAIASLTALDLTIDRPRRAGMVTFKALTVDGQVFDSAEFGDFVVGLPS
jgi:hypothetical protein